VGDMPSDIQAGKAAGTLTCGVFYGYGPKDDILAAEPDWAVENLIQLFDWIE
jgi:phosphoglycolate phosphatase-like HAD superfamily hydrolase